MLFFFKQEQAVGLDVKAILYNHSVAMKQRSPCWIAALLLLAAAGCAPVLIGAGAVGGYAISKDSITNSFDVSFSQLYRVSHEVAAKEGLITQADEARGVIKASVPGANVTIVLKRLTAQTVQLKVKARNDIFLPKIDIAQSIYSQIAEKL